MVSSLVSGRQRWDAAPAATRTSRLPAAPPASVRSPLLQLAQVVGNRTMGRLIQARRDSPEPGDPLEQDAERAADAILRMPMPEATDAAPVALYAFGNTVHPHGPRHKDFGIESDSEEVGPETGSDGIYHGASTFADPAKVSLSGHYYKIPAKTAMPPDVGVIADAGTMVGNEAMPETHHTIFPKARMLFAEFCRRFFSLDWRWSGKKKKEAAATASGPHS